MIAETSASIITQFDATANMYLALSGGLYMQQAPQDVSSPYGVFYISGISREEIMGDADDHITEVEFQFNIFSEDNDGYEMATLVELLIETYNWKDLSIDNYNCVSMQMVSVTNIGFVDEIWQTTIMFSMKIQKD